MDIERINENTLKLFITYSDLEDRGYSREEIWYNRSKGEEMFWDVIGEVNTEDYFDLDGPIWIHINASEQGLEVIVTRANIQTDVEATAMLDSFEENDEVAAQLREMESVIFESFDAESDENVTITTARFTFKDIDEMVPLSKRIVSAGLKSSLYQFEGSYYLHVDFTPLEEQRECKNALALIKEYLKPSRLTIHRLEEYGKVVMSDRAFEQVIEYFA